MFFHLIATSLGYLVLLYEVIHGNVGFFFTFSSWFCISSTLAHTVQLIRPLWYPLGYMLVSFTCFFMLPSAFFTLTTSEETFAKWLIVDLCLHLVLPLCALTHVDDSMFRGPIRPVILSCICFLLYIFFVEIFARPLPYDLSRYTVIVRVLLYTSGFIVQSLGILFVVQLRPSIHV